MAWSDLSLHEQRRDVEFTENAAVISILVDSSIAE
jgi:hypothetical protein